MPRDPLQRIAAALASTHSDEIFDGGHPNFPIADLARIRNLENCLRDVVDRAIIDHDFDLDLRIEVDLVLSTSVHLGVPALTTESLHLGDGHPFHVELRKGFANLFLLERLDDRSNQLQ